MRDRLLGLGEPPRDRLAHVVERDLVVAAAGGCTAARDRRWSRCGGAAARRGAAGLGLGCRGRRAALSAASMSVFTIRPCGPEPFIAARSRPDWAAMRRASGQAKMRSPLRDRLPAWPRSCSRATPRRCGEAGPSGGFASVSAGLAVALLAAVGCGAAAAPPPSSALLSSPSSSKRAIGSLTFTPSVPRAPGSCRACPRRPPRPPWSPCRSRSRR